MKNTSDRIEFSLVQSLSRVWLFATPLTTAHQASLPSPTPRAYSNSCPLNLWCHPTISSSVAPFSSCLQSFPASGYFPKSQFFTSGGQSIGVSTSTSVLPVNIQNWFPLAWTGWISSQSLQRRYIIKMFRMCAIHCSSNWCSVLAWGCAVRAH